MKFDIIITQVKNLREFARDVLHLLYKVDEFSRLKENKVLVNYGSPVNDYNESSIGFLLETKYTENGRNILMSTIDLEDLFYWCDEADWYQKVATRDKGDIFITNEKTYLFSCNQWSEEAECYPDGTLKYPIIKDLALLINIYYPQFSIERINNKYVLVQ